MKNILKKVMILAAFVGIVTLVGCTNEGQTGGEEPPVQEIENINIITKSTILTDTIYETEVYVFESNIPGPRVAIVGGIHGDELAGWETALDFVERTNYFKGTVMIIPRANILATKLEQRYPGRTTSGIYDGVKYSDLNRTFPGKATGTVTQKIAHAITETVINFNPDHIIDLHESLDSHANNPIRLGDLIIYGNAKTSLFACDLTDEYNETSRLVGEVAFSVDTSAPGGSFNEYFGELYPNSYVFTIETNRKLKLSRRIEQQTALLELFFTTIWNETTIL